MSSPATRHVPSGALPDAALRLAGRAIRLETPCGDGSLVWHVWGNGAPVVLLHGGSGGWVHWLRNIDALEAAGRRVIVPDMPGFGASARSPLGDDADSLPPPLEAGLQQIVGDAPCDVVGFSFGGLTTGFWLRQFPQRVARAVLVGAPGMGLWAGRNTLALKPWRHMRDADARRAVHRANLGILMLHDAQAIDDETVAMQQYNVERDRTRGRSLARTDALAQCLAGAQCPVHVIYGEHDALYIGRMDEIRAAFEALPTFAGFELVAGAGHWVQYERAQAFNEALQRRMSLTELHPM